MNTYLVNETDLDLIIIANDKLIKVSNVGLEKDREEAMKLNNNPNVAFETISQMGLLITFFCRQFKNKKSILLSWEKNGGSHVELVSAVLKQQGCPLLITYATKFYWRRKICTHPWKMVSELLILKFKKFSLRTGLSVLRWI